MFFFLMIRRPPRSTLFPTRRSSDLECTRSRCERWACSRVQQGFDGAPEAQILARALPPCRQQACARDIRRSEEHTSELQSRLHLVCRLLLEKKKKTALQ